MKDWTNHESHDVAKYPFLINFFKKIVRNILIYEYNLDPLMSKVSPDFIVEVA
jgi:hypothetical protein